MLGSFQYEYAIPLYVEVRYLREDLQIYIYQYKVAYSRKSEIRLELNFRHFALINLIEQLEISNWPSLPHLSHVQRLHAKVSHAKLLHARMSHVRVSHGHYILG